MSKKLYHVTGADNAILILKNGFRSGYFPSEGGQSRHAAEEEIEKMRKAELDEEDDNGEEFFLEYDETPHEVLVREAFNSLLSIVSSGYDSDIPRLPKEKRNLPAHDNAVFFWKNPDRAIFTKSGMNRNNPYHAYTILEVDPSKIPCTCYEADIDYVERLFYYASDHLQAAERCVSGQGFDDEDDEEKCEEMLDIAADYYKTMQRLDLGKELTDKDLETEVLCPCNIPPEAVKAFRG